MFTDTIRRNRRRIIMGKLIYEILVNSLGLPIEPILEYVIIFLVNEIAHEIAYSFSPRGKLGSLIYWITKLLSFIMMWAVLYFLIIIIQFIIKY